MKKIVFGGIFFFLLQIHSVYAQKDTSNSISLTLFQGLKTFSSYDSPLKGKSLGAEVSYQFNLARDTAEWVRRLRVEDIGLAASYFNMSNVSISGMPGSQGLLGSSLGLMSYLDICLVKIGYTKLIFSPGIGFDYITQTFYTNHNPIVGSHINVAAQAGFKLEMPLFSPATRLDGGFKFTHSSNGGFQMPNNGINNFFWLLGITHDIDRGGPISQKTTFDIDDDKGSFEGSIGIGIHGGIKSGYFKTPQGGVYDTTGQKKVPKLYHVVLYAGYSYPLNSVFSLKAGIDGVYYPTTFQWNNFLKTYEGDFSSYQHISIGISAGTDIWLGERLAFMGSYGYYLRYNTPYPVKFYWVAGIKYHLNSWIAITTKVYMDLPEQPGCASIGVLFGR